ncbi:MAG: hypothetical protein GYA51_09825 [Candidatus Methanofastidiosa archaeon]|nr:hypothetical protein [Candidatus Methanofastidiosa archaeon]
MTYIENIATGFSWFIGPLFAMLIFYILILLINRIVERYEEERNDSQMQMAQKLLEELKLYSEE